MDGRRSGIPGLGATALLVVLLLPLVPLPAAAEGNETVGISPTEVVVRDAQRNQSYVRRVLVQNQFNESSVVTLALEGEVGGWSSVPATTINVPARTTSVIDVTIRIPQEATNGTHLGGLRVTANAKAKPDGSGFAFQYGAFIKLNATLSGVVVIKNQLVRAKVEDVEVGTAPVAAAVVRNDGNVKAKATVLAQIFDQNGNVLLSRTVEVDLLPGQEAEVPLSFAQDLPPGTYTLKIQSSNPGGDLAERVSQFAVVGAGMLGKKISLGDAAVLTGKPVPGRVMEISVQFANTGNVTIGRAHLSGKILHDGSLFDVVDGNGEQVPPGRNATLSIFFKPDRAGHYVVNLSVLYDNVKRDMGTIQFDVSDAVTTPWYLQPITLFGLILPVPLILFLFLLMRRRRKEDEPPAAP